MGKAYEGKEPYIFISYAHKDSKVVLATVNALQRKGFRVWYDGGIEAGTEWPEYIASHLKNCDCVLSFISESFVESDNCRRELIFAQEEKKPMLNVFIDSVNLTDGMRMQLGLNQAVFKKNFHSLAAFYEEIAGTKVVQNCKIPATEEPTSVFIGFAPDDYPTAAAIADSLRQKGYTVWCDDDVARPRETRITDCDCFFAVITQRYVESDFCRRELLFAQQSEKPILNVYMEEVLLSDGMRMQFGLNQAIFRARYETESAFYEALSEAAILKDDKKSVDRTEEHPAQEAPETPVSKKKKKKTAVRNGSEDTVDTVEKRPAEKKKNCSHYVWLAALLELSYSAVGPLSLELLTRMEMHWLLVFACMLIPHTAIGLVIVLMMNAVAKKNRIDGFELLLAPFFCVFLSTVFAAVFGVAHVHIVENILLKILIAVGSNIVPALIVCQMIILGSYSVPKSGQNGTAKKASGISKKNKENGTYR